MSSRLNFGVEIEFLLARIDWKRDTDPNPDDGRPVHGLHELQPTTVDADPDLIPNYPFDEFRLGSRVRSNIVNKLREAGLRARIQPTPFERPSIVELYQREWDSSPSVSKWILSENLALHAPRNPYVYTWEKVVLISPAFHALPDSFDQIEIAMHVIRKNYRILINSSCSFRVNVGSGLERFELQRMQDLLALLWTFEPQISMLHPPKRQSHVLALPIRSHSMLAAKGRFAPDSFTAKAAREENDYGILKHGKVVSKDVHEIYVLDAIHTLFSTTEINQEFDEYDPWPSNLSWQLCQYNKSSFSEERMAYEIRDLSEDDKSKQILEFRQHAGALDLTTMMIWIKTVLGLAAFTRDTDRLSLTDFLNEQARREDVGESRLTTLQILSLAGLGQQAEFYDPRLRRDIPEANKARQKLANEVLRKSIGSQERMLQRPIGTAPEPEFIPVPENITITEDIPLPEENVGIDDFTSTPAEVSEDEQSVVSDSDSVYREWRKPRSIPGDAASEVDIGICLDVDGNPFDEAIEYDVAESVFEPTTQYQHPSRSSLCTKYSEFLQKKDGIWEVTTINSIRPEHRWEVLALLGANEVVFETKSRVYGMLLSETMITEIVEETNRRTSRAVSNNMPGQVFPTTGMWDRKEQVLTRVVRLGMVISSRIKTQFASQDEFVQASISLCDPDFHAIKELYRTLLESIKVLKDNNDFKNHFRGLGIPVRISEWLIWGRNQMTHEWGVLYHDVAGAAFLWSFLNDEFPNVILPVMLGELYQITGYETLSPAAEALKDRTMREMEHEINYIDDRLKRGGTKIGGYDGLDAEDRARVCAHYGADDAFPEDEKFWKTDIWANYGAWYDKQSRLETEALMESGEIW